MSDTPRPPAGRFGVMLVRHAETEWSMDGRHTSRTDIPLTDQGRTHALSLQSELGGERFVQIFVSPARRALETCELCAPEAPVQELSELREWDYGEYEGLTSAEIERAHPGWSLWRDGCPGGESAEQVGARADLVIERLLAAEGPVAVFSHGHLLRVLGARWAQLEPSEGARLALSTGAVCLLGYEHEKRVLWHWNT